MKRVLLTTAAVVGALTLVVVAVGVAGAAAVVSGSLNPYDVWEDQ